MKLKISLIFALLFILVVGGFVAIKFYPYVFAKTVRGEILRVEKVAPEGAIITSGQKGAVPADLFSFAVAIRDSRGEIHTSSSEDRQWAVAEKGQCVESKFFPYPFWQFDKANTYYGARLERLFECDAKLESPADNE